MRTPSLLSSSPLLSPQSTSPPTSPASAPMARCCCQISGCSAPSASRSPVGDFPVNSRCIPAANSPPCSTAVTASTRSSSSISRHGTIASRTKLAEAFYGLAFSQDGTRLFCSGSAGKPSTPFVSPTASSPTTPTIAAARREAARHPRRPRRHRRWRTSTPPISGARASAAVTSRRR